MCVCAHQQIKAGEGEKVENFQSPRKEPLQRVIDFVISPLQCEIQYFGVCAVAVAAFLHKAAPLPSPSSRDWRKYSAVLQQRTTDLIRGSFVQ